MCEETGDSFRKKVSQASSGRKVLFVRDQKQCPAISDPLPLGHPFQVEFYLLEACKKYS